MIRAAAAAVFGVVVDLIRDNQADIAEKLAEEARDLLDGNGAPPSPHPQAVAAQVAGLAAARANAVQEAGRRKR